MVNEVEPRLVSTAREMVADGRSWRDIVPELEAQADGDRAALAHAALHWVRQMRSRASSDFAASAVLRALEAALNRTPRAEAGASGSVRRSRRLAGEERQSRRTAAVRK